MSIGGQLQRNTVLTEHCRHSALTAELQHQGGQLASARADLAVARRSVQSIKAAAASQRLASERADVRLRARYAEATLAASRGVAPQLAVVSAAFATGSAGPSASIGSIVADAEQRAAQRGDENRILKRIATDSLNALRRAAHSVHVLLPGNEGRAPPQALGTRDVFPPSQSLPTVLDGSASHPATRALVSASEAITAGAEALRLVRASEASTHAAALRSARDAGAESALDESAKASSVLGASAASAHAASIGANGILRVRSDKDERAELQAKLVHAVTRLGETEARLAAAARADPRNVANKLEELAEQEAMLRRRLEKTEADEREIETARESLRHAQDELRRERIQLAESRLAASAAAAAATPGKPAAMPSPAILPTGNADAPSLPLPTAELAVESALPQHIAESSPSDGESVGAPAETSPATGSSSAGASPPLRRSARNSGGGGASASPTQAAHKPPLPPVASSSKRRPLGDLDSVDAPRAKKPSHKSAASVRPTQSTPASAGPLRTSHAQNSSGPTGAGASDERKAARRVGDAAAAADQNAGTSVAGTKREGRTTNEERVRRARERVRARVGAR